MARSAMAFTAAVPRTAETHRFGIEHLLLISVECSVEAARGRGAGCEAFGAFSLPLLHLIEALRRRQLREL